MHASPQTYDAGLGGQVARVRICDATWQVTVLGFGAQALPGYVLC